MKTELRRACPSCGNQFSGAVEFCPVCILRKALGYFYAMEFVEGETLEHLIRRSGRIEMQSALDITTQVATGLAAVHEQNLVHRDIKPSNIMVNTNGAYYLNRNNHTGSQLSQVDVHNPNTNCTSTAVLPLDDLLPSPRQFQKLVFSQAQGDENTLSAGKTNLRTTWKEFLADVEKMPVVEHSELHIDNSDEGWLE
jgi:serine/threonine protein kinase